MGFGGSIPIPAQRDPACMIWGINPSPLLWSRGTCPFPARIPSTHRSEQGLSHQGTHHQLAFLINALFCSAPLCTRSLPALRVRGALPRRFLPGLHPGPAGQEWGCQSTARWCWALPCLCQGLWHNPGTPGSVQVVLDAPRVPPKSPHPQHLPMPAVARIKPRLLWTESNTCARCWERQCELPTALPESPALKSSPERPTPCASEQPVSCPGSAQLSDPSPAPTAPPDHI